MHKKITSLPLADFSYFFNENNAQTEKTYSLKNDDIIAQQSLFAHKLNQSRELLSQARDNNNTTHLPEKSKFFNNTLSMQKSYRTIQHWEANHKQNQLKSVNELRIDF